MKIHSLITPSRLTFLILLTALAIGGTLYWRSQPKDQDQKVKTSKIVLGDITTEILTTGVIQPQNRLEIKPPVPGRIEQILVVEGQQIKKGQILAWMSSNERAALIDAAHAKGPDEVKKWEELYQKTPIIAPITGMIILRNVESGQTFTSNDAVLVMSNRLTIKAQVDETDLAQIHLNHEAIVRLDAYPNQYIRAHVLKIAYEAKTVNNVTTYIIDVLPDETSDFMRSGMTANVSFIGATKKNIVLVSNEFLRYEESKPYVQLQLGSSGKTETRFLELGLTDGRNSEVLSGLVAGDNIVLSIKKKDWKSTNPFSPMNQKPPRKL